MKAIIATLSVLVLTACSTSGSKTSQSLKPQYCYTNQEIELRNGETVGSLTRVECTDDRTRQLFQARAGIAKDCVEFSFPMNIRGQLVERTAYACQKFSGTYEIFNPTVNR
jgi:hypothetical protein